MVRDPFTGALVVATGLMVLVGSILLVDYQSVITSPDDYRILGFQPISSRTYFAVRLTNVLIYTAIPTTAFACRRRSPTASSEDSIRHLAQRRSPPSTAPGWSDNALGVVVLYAGLLRLFRPNACSARCPTFKCCSGSLIYGAVPLSTSLIDAEVLGRLTVATSPWLLLHPASWFASYLDVAQGRPRRGGDRGSRAAVGGRARRAGAGPVSGRLSMDYSERLGAMLATTAVAGRSKIASAGGRSRGGR